MTSPTETRLQLRAEDMASLARQPQLGDRDLEMLVGFAYDIVADADVTLRLGHELPPKVKPIIGLLRAITRLAGNTGAF